MGVYSNRGILFIDTKFGSNGSNQKLTTTFPVFSGIPWQLIYVINRIF